MIPPGSIQRGLGQPPLHRPAGQRVQQAALQDHRRRHRPGGRVGRGDAGRARLRGHGLHVPRLAAPRALDRRPGRDQRRQGLPQRRRLDLPALLRHDQGRRLPLARGQRLPARAGVERDHRPGDRAGRAVRARVRRVARQPLVRRRAGVAHVLRARPDRPAAAARCLPGDDAPGRGRQGRSCTRAPRCSTSWSTDGLARGIVMRDLLTGEMSRTPRTPSCSPPAATATRSSCRPTRRPPTPPRSGARTSAARRSRTRASRRSTRRASRSPTTRSPSSR